MTLISHWSMQGLAGLVTDYIILAGEPRPGIYGEYSDRPGRGTIIVIIHCLLNILTSWPLELGRDGWSRHEVRWGEGSAQIWRPGTMELSTSALPPCLMTYDLSYLCSFCCPHAACRMLLGACCRWRGGAADSQQDKMCVAKMWLLRLQERVHTVSMVTSASKSSIRRFVITEKAPTTQFHVERPWGQRPFSIVS